MMKFSPIPPILAIVATLATSAVVMTNPLQAISSPSAKLATTGQLLAKVGKAPLAKQLQGKPVVVDIYASWCRNCKNIEPTLSQLKLLYSKKMHLIVFDVSDRQKTQASTELAAKLGLTDFFNANKSQTSTVAIIDPASGKIIKEFQHNPNLTEYTAIVDRSILQMRSSATAKMGRGDAMKKKEVNAMKKP
jgi:thiol-disulfide isomerase/thioredoxin